MTDTNQKLREALQAISDIDDSTNHAVDASAALDRIGQIARQALALPTDEQVGDINVVESFTSVTKTAEPVVEREAFDAWLGITPCGAAHDFGWAAWQARAALSAGDAADAQRYRWLMDNCTLGIKQNGVGWSLNTTACIAPDCIKDVGATIDAAMRKGQL